MAKIVGLTGGIASGKSVVARILADEHGLPVIDADRIARDVVAEGTPGHAELIRRFGSADRGALRATVFADPARRKELEAFLHPLIQAESRKRISAAAGDLVFYEAALLIEAGRAREFDALAVVDAPRALRRARLLERDGITEALADQMLAAQVSDEERRKLATHLIRNTGTIDELRREVAACLKKLRA